MVAMINRLRIRNFKSFRDLDLRLTDVSVLVGPNMSGKSNLLDAFRFLVQLLNPAPGTTLQNAINERSGFGEIVWKGGNETVVAFAVEGTAAFRGEVLTFNYELEITGNQYGYGGIQGEHLHIVGRHGESDLITTGQNGVRVMKRADGREISQLQDPNNVALQYALPDWEGSAVRGAMASAKFYNLLPPAMRKPNPSTGADFLTEYGDNLSSWLMTLQTRHQEAFQRIRSVAQDVLPNLLDIFTFPTQQSTVYLSSREKHLLRPTPLAQMSDGELTFLAWVSLVLAPAKLGTSLYCIEEPENHLHPRLIDVIFELLRQVRSELEDGAIDRVQLIITTHSPYVIDKCAIDELVLVQKEGGESKCTRPRDQSELCELLKDKSVTLGELYFSGALRGA
jgi:predicted ATPase